MKIGDVFYFLSFDNYPRISVFADQIMRITPYAIWTMGDKIYVANEAYKTKEKAEKARRKLLSDWIVIQKKNIVGMKQAMYKEMALLKDMEKELEK